LNIGQNNKSEIINCYIIKPINEDSKVSSISELNDSVISVERIVNRIRLNEPTTIDSSVIMVTNFERQKEIFINAKCSSLLQFPDSLGLMNIYFNSGYHTKIMNHSIVDFLQSYSKDVYGFGKATVFEYEFKGVSETEPHYLFIIVRDQDENSKRYGRDLSGIAICSDGLSWEELGKGGEQSLPIYLHMIRRGKELRIPLLYKMGGFRPIGHFIKALE
jgi:hypothetical protein